MIFLISGSHRLTSKSNILLQKCLNFVGRLEENQFIHGNIRCRKVFVSVHNDNEFKVKLGDPGIHKIYSPSELHWIPVDCRANLEYIKRSPAADVWAFATTLWEIFSFGKDIQPTDYVQPPKGTKRLKKPEKCPSEIYQVMIECWEVDQFRRKKPQAVMRDLNQIMYQVYNSRIKHAYAKISALRSVASTSSTSINSGKTDSTCLVDNELLPVDNMIEFSDCSSPHSFYNPYFNGQYDKEDTISYDFPPIVDFTLDTSLNSSSIQTLFEIDHESDLLFHGLIGRGHYGDVYKGTIQRTHDSVYRQVAVKKLHPSTDPTNYQNFEREVSIMKMLKHENIIEIISIVDTDTGISIVMEYLPHGSLDCYLKIHKDNLSIKQLLSYAYDTAKGMEYLRTKNIVHRDLAARNILVADEQHVKITDFGLAQVMQDNYYILKTNRDLPLKWYAIESLKEHKFSSKSDVWSYGVTLYEMFSHGEDPNLPMPPDKLEKNVPEQQLMLDALESGIRLPCPQFCTTAIYVTIMKPCWESDPHLRPTFTALGTIVKKAMEEQ